MPDACAPRRSLHSTGRFRTGALLHRAEPTRPARVAGNDRSPGRRAVQAERFFAAGVMDASWLAASRANRSARNFAVLSRMACLSARYSAMACWPSRNRSSFFCKAVEPRSEVSGEFVLNVVTPFCRGPGNARQSLVYLGQIVEALIMRHNALQGPITSIRVGLSAMETRHRPCGDGKVVNDRDDDDAPGLLAIRAGAKLGDDQPLDIVLGLRKFFHDRTMTDLGSRTDHRLFQYVG